MDKEIEIARIVPGGHLNFGEKLHDCFRREIKEETNLDIDNIELIQVKESVFLNEYYKKKHLIFVDYMAKFVSNDVKLNSELKEYRWVSLEDVFSLELVDSVKKMIEVFIDRLRNIFQQQKSLNFSPFFYFPPTMSLWHTYVN